MTLPRNIILAGFMGTGKTTVGRVLAARLGWKFMDTERLIEERAACSVPEIFEKQGEDTFRQLERAVAEELKNLKKHVIATGGGMVVDAQNRMALEEAGLLVLLTARAETIYERVSRA